MKSKFSCKTQITLSILKLDTYRDFCLLLMAYIYIGNLGSQLGKKNFFKNLSTEMVHVFVCFFRADGTTLTVRSLRFLQLSESGDMISFCDVYKNSPLKRQVSTGFTAEEQIKCVFEPRCEKTGLQGF